MWKVKMLCLLSRSEMATKQISKVERIINMSVKLIHQHVRFKQFIVSIQVKTDFKITCEHIFLTLDQN